MSKCDITEVTVILVVWLRVGLCSTIKIMKRVVEKMVGNQMAKGKLGETYKSQ